MKHAVLLLAAIAGPAWAQKLPEDTMNYAVAERDARLSLSPTGPWLPVAAKPGDVFYVTDARGARVQFTFHDRMVRLVLYVDRGALRKCALAGARLTPGPRLDANAGTSAPGMLVDPGAELSDLAAVPGGFVRVTITLPPYSRDAFELHGYLPATKIGVVAPRFGPVSHVVADAQLPPDFELLDAPLGKPFFARHAPGKEPEEVQVLRRAQGHALVNALGVVGWIASDKVQPLPPPRSGSLDDLGGVEGGTDGGDATPSVPLYDGVRGAFVGVTNYGFTAAPAEHREGWTRYEVPTAYGTLSLWTRPGHDVARSVAASKPRSGLLAGLPSAPPPPPPPPRSSRAQVTPWFDVRVLTPEGLSRETLEPVIRARTAQIAQCYVAGPEVVPLDGQLYLEFQVGANGVVDRTRILRTVPADLPARTSECVTAVVKATAFPAAQASTEVETALRLERPERASGSPARPQQPRGGPPAHTPPRILVPRVVARTGLSSAAIQEKLYGHASIVDCISTAPDAGSAPGSAITLVFAVSGDGTVTEASVLGAPAATSACIAAAVKAIRFPSSNAAGKFEVAIAMHSDRSR